MKYADHAEEIVILISILLFVSFAVVGYTQLSKASSSQIEGMGDTTRQMIERKYEKYVGTGINGATVLNACNSYKDEYYINIKYPTKIVTFDKTTGDINNLPSSTNYIDPNLLFTGDLIWDANGSLVGMSFVRE